MYNYLHDTDKCIIKNCEQEQKEAIQFHSELTKEFTNVLQQMNNKKISSAEGQKRIKKINKQFIENNKKLKFLDCQFSKCNKLIMKKIISNIKDDINLFSNDPSDKPLYENSNKFYSLAKKQKIGAKEFIQYEKEARKLAKNEF